MMAAIRQNFRLFGRIQDAPRQLLPRSREDMLCLVVSGSKLKTVLVSSETLNKLDLFVITAPL